MKVQKIPTDVEIDREFTRFENMANEPFVKDFMLRDELIAFFKSTGYVRTPYLLKPDFIFRARSLPCNTLEEALEKVTCVSELSYAPAKFINLPGRCNKVQESVFYASNENGVPVFEVRPEAGRYVVSSAFRSKKESKISVIAPIVGVRHLLDAFKKGGYGHDWVTMLEKDQVFTESQPHLIKIDDKISEWFMLAVDNGTKVHYRLTTILYKIFTEDVHHIKKDGDYIVADGLVYPSVAAAATGANLALKTSFVDKHLDFLGAMIYHYEGKNADDDMVLHMLRASIASEITEDGKLVWHSPDEKQNSVILGPELAPIEFPSVFAN